MTITPSKLIAVVPVASATPSPKPMTYAGPNPSQIANEKEHAIRAAAERLIQGIKTRSGSMAIPPAISLKEVLTNSDKYRGEKIKIALTDVDGTTRHGQYWLGWLLDVLRYGPKQATGLGFGRLLKTIIPAIRLRFQEKKNGEADPAKVNQVIASALKGLDGTQAQKSFDLFYKVFGKRGLSAYMKRKFDYHRSEGHLIIGVSASPEYLVQKHAVDLEIPPENFFGTTIELNDKNKATGAYRLLRGEEKMKLLEEKVFGPLGTAGIDFEIDSAYSDSDSDLPMLKHAHEKGGTPVAVNAPREEFEKEVLEMNGTVIRETAAWPGEGRVEEVYFSSKDYGELKLTDKTPPARPAVLDNLQHYGTQMAATGGGFAIAGTITNITQAGEISWDSFQLDAGSVAAGALTAGACEVFLPKSDDRSLLRKWFLRDLAPLTSSMYFSSDNPAASSPLAFACGAFGASLTTSLTLGLMKSAAHGLGFTRTERFLESRRTVELFVRPAQRILFRLFYLLGKTFEN